MSLASALQRGRFLEGQGSAQRSRWGLRMLKESNGPAVLVPGRWRAQLGKDNAVLREQLPVPLPVSAGPSLHLPLVLHLSVLLLSFSLSYWEALWGWEFQM